MGVILADFYSGFLAPPNGGTKYRLHTQISLNSQDVNGNASSVHWQTVIEKDRSYAGFYWFTASWNTVVNGTTVLSGSGTGTGSKPDAPWTGWKNWELGNSDITIAHNADGTKTGVAVSGTYVGLNNTWAPGTITLVGALTFDLPPIAQATVPTVTPSPVIIGGVATFNLPRTNSAFTHDLTYVAGTLSGSIATAQATSYAWTVPDVSTGFTGAGPWPIVVTVVTKNGAAVVGTNVVTLMERSVPAAPSLLPHNPKTQFDIRVRQVTWDGTSWAARKQLPMNQITLVENSSATGTCQVAMSGLNSGGFPDYSIIDLDVYDGTNWRFTNHRFYLTRTIDDATDITNTARYEGVELVDYLLARNYVQADLFWDGSTNHAAPTTPGNMLKYALDQAKARGWGPRFNYSFNASVDSNGVPWANAAVSRNFTKGTPVSQMLTGLVDDGLVEYRVHYDSASNGTAWLDVYNAGTGLSFADVGASPIVNLGLAPLSRAPRRSTTESRITAVTVVGDGNAIVTRTSTPFDTTVLGRLEGWVSAPGNTTADPLNAIGDHALRDNGAATAERTFEIQAANLQPQFFPFVIYKTGDWVYRPGLVKDRVAQLTVTKTADNSLSITVVTGSRILSGSATLAKRQAAQTGGAISGGTQVSPNQLDSRIPSGPTINTVTSLGYWTVDGAAKSAVTVTWAPVTTSLNGGPINVTLYEVYSRPTAIGAPWQLRTATSQATVTMDNYDPLLGIDVRVRAQSFDAIYGEFSVDQENIIPAAPGVSIADVNLSNLYTDGVGNIYAVWGGLVGGSAPPSYLNYVVAEVSVNAAAYVQMGTPIVAAGPIIFNPGLFGDFVVRLRGYDRLGNAGTVSSTLAISTVDPHVAPATPVAVTSLTATAGAAWGSTGFLPTAWFDLAWTAPTLDTNGAAISVAGYDVYGLKAGETVERFLTTSATSSVRIPVGNSEQWTFRVKAISNFGGVSLFSASVTATANAAISAAAAPTAPTLSQYAGILQIQWAGGGMVPQIKYVYASISQTLGGTYTRAGMPLIGAGEVDVPGLAPGNYYAKITMVDQLGSAVTSAASALIVLLPITGTTYQTSSLPNTGIKITTGSLTAYNAAGNPTFILNAATGEVFIAPYNAVFDLGATGTLATTGAAVTGIAISSQGSTFNTFINPSGLQIRAGQTPLSWWEADSSDGGLVNFFSPRAAIGTRLRVGDHEMLKEARNGGVGTRIVTRYKGA